MLERLKRIPYFLFLISIFFVLHGVLENFGFISFKDAAVLILYYLALTLLIAGIFWLLLRNKQHAAIITTAFMAFFFFYSPFMDFIKEKYPDSFFNKYTFLLSVIVITMVVIFIYLKRSNKVFPQLSLFLNALFITYILIDIGWLMVKVVNPPLNPLSIYSFAKEKDTLTCKSCAKPNVYFLLFDEYASSLSLKEQFNFDNSPLDNFLLKEGFHINRQSNSNYNYTPFSMASVLNMSYIEGLKDPSHLVAQDFTNVNQLIRNNKVIKIFSSLGYQLKIYSIFDIAGYPAKAWQSFLPLKTRLITERTLAARLRKSTESLLIRRFNIKYFVVQNYMNYLFSNEKFLKLAAEEADQKNSSPKFVYAHFIMPHFPYIFDSLGHRKNDRQIYEDIQNNPPPAYLNYLQYTNRRIEELVEHIRQKDPNAVILLCGDHGYRYPTNKPRPFSHLQNLNAVYFPDQDYSKWGDKISFVNQFRIVFNKLFQFNYPLLKDSTIFLFEKQAGD